VDGKLFLEGCRVKPQIPSSKSQSNPNDQIPNPKLHVPVIGDNIEVPAVGPQPWMLELAKMLILKELPTGVIVGTASIREVVKGRFQRLLRL
jgi:hypothetical protein